MLTSASRESYSPAEQRTDLHLVQRLLDGGELRLGLGEGVRVVLLPARRERVPDLMFVARQHLERVKPTYLDGPADLVVEIVSPDSVGRDRGDKFVEYERAGIPEYWLIDPDREQAELYELDPNGRYHLALSGRSGVYRSAVLQGFPLDLDWLWQQPPPKALPIVRQLGLLDG